VNSVEMNKHIFRIFHHSSFSVPNFGSILTGTFLMAASNTGGEAQITIFDE